MPFTIAIDGPAGAGKSTVARRIASELRFTYLDTGAMYRGIAWKALRYDVPIDDEDAVADVARCARLTLSPLSASGDQRVEVDGIDVTDAIRSPEVSSATSAISAFTSVRRLMVAQQREIGGRAVNGVVLEGRDIGTVVFPNAEMKLFLTASPESRAERRYAELRSRGADVTFDEVLADQIRRDERNARADSPLTAAPDARTIDSDALSVDQVVGAALAIYREIAGGYAAARNADDYR